jgi:hypothetical protein
MTRFQANEVCSSLFVTFSRKWPQQQGCQQHWLRQSLLTIFMQLGLDEADTFKPSSVPIY